MTPSRPRRPRKPRPTLIFCEEVTHRDPLYNSTRQTFDQKQFDAWRKLPRSADTQVVFAVGQISWVDAA